jgi:hypothetical protein
MAEGGMPADHLVFPGVEDVAGDVGHGEIGAGDVGHGDVGAGFTTASQVLAQQRTNLRWTDPMSGFVLRHMCQLITTGVRTDKGFKEVHLNQVAKALHEFSGQEVTGTQVYNHLRKWRQRWVRVTKLRELSGALWDEDACMIVLEEEHYNGHTQVSNLSTECPLLTSNLFQC